MVTVMSDLTIHKVFDNNNGSEIVVDICSLRDHCQDIDDYLDLFQNRSTLRLERLDSQEPSSRQVEITFLDTPGSEDTNNHDIENTEAIINNIIALGSLNLILVIVNCDDFASINQQLILGYYSRVITALQGHHSNVVFLYTHLKYKRCHHSDTDYHSEIKTRHKAFSNLF